MKSFLVLLVCLILTGCAGVVKKSCSYPTMCVLINSTLLPTAPPSVEVEDWMVKKLVEAAKEKKICLEVYSVNNVSEYSFAPKNLTFLWELQIRTNGTEGIDSLVSAAKELIKIPFVKMVWNSQFTIR